MAQLGCDSYSAICATINNPHFQSTLFGARFKSQLFETTGISHNTGMLDINDFVTERGGEPEKIRESQRRRYAKPEIVEEVIAMYEDHRRSETARSAIL